jgi:parvulin-like peptidyl-prolyl isomerase
VARRQPYARAGVRHFVVGHRDSPGPAKRERSREEALAIALAGFKRLTDDPSAWNQVVADASDEPGSRAVGGYIGDFTTVAEPAQRMAPEIERELLRMTPGARSDDVVESRFGFHVFWRLD